MERKDNNLINIDNLKSLSIEDLISLITAKNSNSIVVNDKASSKVIFNTEQLLQNYPMFTRYGLDIAIKKEGLPFFRIGHKRYFEAAAIDKWIEANNKPLVTAIEKKRYN